MTFIFINCLAVVVMIFFTVKKGTDRTIVRRNVSAILFWIALTILTLYGAFFLAFAIGEVAGGDLSGAMHLVPAVIIYVLVYLCWRRPFEGGITLLACSVISGIGAIPVFLSRSVGNYFSVFLGVLPSLCAGSLLLLASILARRRGKVNPDPDN